MAVYFNPSLGSGGTGTEADPHGSLTTFNALTGDQSGEVYLIKAGTTSLVNIVNASAYNFRLDRYGDGVAPIIDTALGANYSVSLSGGNGITVAHLNLKNALATGLNIAGTTCNNLRLFGNEISGVNGVGAEDAINIKPDGLSTGVEIRGNNLHDCGGNAIEVGLSTSPVITDNFGHDCAQSVEFWYSVTGALVEFNRFWDMAGDGVWFANADSVTSGVAGSGTEAYTNNIVRNNTFIGGSLIHCQADGAGTINATGNEFYNNTVVSNVYSTMIRLDSGSAFKIVNNIIYVRYSGSGGVSNSVSVTAAAAVGSDIDHNYYYFAEEAGVRTGVYSMPKFYDGSTTYQDGSTSVSNALQKWAVGTGFDTHSWGGDGGGDPFTDLANGDISLLSTGEAPYDAATQTTVSTLAPEIESALTTADRDHNARYGNNDVGGLQFQRHPDITTGISLK